VGNDGAGATKLVYALTENDLNTYGVQASGVQPVGYKPYGSAPLRLLLGPTL